MEWDVTQDVQKFVQKQYPNYGWRIRDEIPWGKVNIPITYFYSKEHGYFKPHLEVVINDYPPNKPATASRPTTVKIGVALCIVHMQSIQKEFFQKADDFTFSPKNNKRCYFYGNLSCTINGQR